MRLHLIDGWMQHKLTIHTTARDTPESELFLNRGWSSTIPGDKINDNEFKGPRLNLWEWTTLCGISLKLVISWKNKDMIYIC